MQKARNYKKEYREYHGKPDQKRKRAARGRARTALGLQVGDPREVDHKIPLYKGGSNRRNNLRAVSFKANRSRKRP